MRHGSALLWGPSEGPLGSCRAFHGYCVKQPTLSSHLRSPRFARESSRPRKPADGSSALGLRDPLDLLEVARDFLAGPQLLRSAEERERIAVATHAHQHLRVVDPRVDLEGLDA